MFYLQVGDGHSTNLDDFCASDESICHHNKCQGEENSFCSMRDSSVVISYFAAAMAVLHGIAILAICMDQTTACLVPSDKAYIFASRVSWIQVTSAALYTILLFVWGDCVGRLPDLVTDGLTWKYLPASEGLVWGLDLGFYLLVFVALLMITAAVCSIIGSKKLAETVPSHLRDQRTCSEWAWKTHVALSAFTTFLAFVVAFVVLLSNSFVTSVQLTPAAPMVGLTATMFSLRAGSNTTTIPEFCARGVTATTCGNASCEHMEDRFCSYRYIAVSLIFLAMIAMIFHFVATMAVCLDLKACWESHPLCSKQARSRAPGSPA